MAKFYYTQIKLGNMTIDEVPTGGEHPLIKC